MFSIVVYEGEALSMNSSCLFWFLSCWCSHGKILKIGVHIHNYLIMLGMQFNKSRFGWEAKDRLSDLEQFKQECTVLSQGPLSEMKDPQQAGLIVNWIGRKWKIILYSICIRIDGPKTVFNALEEIFRPEAKQTLSRFKFRSLNKGRTRHAMLICQS